MPSPGGRAQYSPPHLLKGGQGSRLRAQRSHRFLGGQSLGLPGSSPSVMFPLWLWCLHVSWRQVWRRQACKRWRLADGAGPVDPCPGTGASRGSRQNWPLRPGVSGCETPTQGAVGPVDFLDPKNLTSNAHTGVQQCLSQPHWH